MYLDHPNTAVATPPPESPGSRRPDRARIVEDLGSRYSLRPATAGLAQKMVEDAPVSWIDAAVSVAKVGQWSAAEILCRCRCLPLLLCVVYGCVDACSLCDSGILRTLT